MYACLCACGPACRSVGLPASLSNCRSVCLSAQLRVGLLVCRPVGLSVGRPVGRSASACRSACLSASALACRHVCMSASLSNCRSVCLSACLHYCLSACWSVAPSVCRSVGRSVAARRPVAHRSSLLAPSTQAIFACVLACRPVGLSLAPSHSDSPSGDTRRGHATTAPQVPSATREAAASTGIPTACLAAGAVASVIPSC